MAIGRMCCSTCFPSLCPEEGFRREVPVVTTAKLVSMSWPLCAISEDNVAGAVTTLLETKEQKYIVIQPLDRSAAMGSLLL